MADLLYDEAVAFVRSDVFICLSKERVEGFGYTADRGSVFGSCKSGYVDHSLR